MKLAESPSVARQTGDVNTAQDTLKDILDASREGMLIVDPSLRISAANSPAHEIFSRKPETMEGRRLSEVVRDVHLHDAVRMAISESGKTDLRLELTSAETRTFDVHISPIELAGLRSAIVVIYEITKLERLERARQEFLSNISHELRTPLTSILAYVETLEDSAIDDPINNRRFLAVIRRNAERMRSLIADISELSQIETGNVSLEIRKTNVSTATDDIFAALSSKALTRRIALVNEILPDTMVDADPVRLDQMLTNLIDNAIKFNRESGTVTVSSASTDTSVTISVADTGEGIMSDNLQRIFERFYRIDRGRARDVGGTGLGLAIVKHLARLHGGEVTVASKLGHGTVFTIELPRL